LVEVKRHTSKMYFIVVFTLCFLQTISGLEILTIGDFGDSTANGIIRQEELSKIMSDWCGFRKCDFILNSGDNFYQSGVLSVDDPRFNTSWLWVYDKPNIADLTWYMSLGNHDYGTVDDRELFQVEYSLKEPRWVLPYLWYDFTVTEADYTIHFVVVDAMSILLKKHNWEGELAWYEQTLAESTADWLIIVEHYPPFTAGGYATGSLVHRSALVPAAERFGVDLFIAGHDHNLQHLAKSAVVDVDYIVTAGGGRGLYAFDVRGNQTLSQMGIDVKYFGYHNGFVMLDFSQNEVVADYVDLKGDLVYSFTRQRKRNTN